MKKVIEILTAPRGLARSPKRITVSSVGKLPQLRELLEETQVHVAISVHTADAYQRESMMPAQKAFPIATVMKLLSGYDFSHQRRLSLEYIMWRNVNDDIAHAEMLVRLIGQADCRVNLIRFHAIPELIWCLCSEDRMLMFRSYLNSKESPPQYAHRAGRISRRHAACLPNSLTEIWQPQISKRKGIKTNCKRLRFQNLV